MFSVVFKTIILLVYLFLIPFVWIQTWVFGVYTIFSSKMNYQIAIVFGASVLSSKEPSKVLRLRLEKAIELYINGQVSKILVSGDNSDLFYNEPEAMRTYLNLRGIPLEDIVADFGGVSTIDSCYRASKYFKVKKAILITQAFHLGRTTALCQSFGMQVMPVAADDPSRIVTNYGVLREVLACGLASWNMAKGDSYQPQVIGNGSEIIIDEF